MHPTWYVADTPLMYSVKRVVDASVRCRSTVSWLLADVLAYSWTRSDSLPLLAFLCLEKKRLKAPVTIIFFFLKYPFLSLPKRRKVLSPTLAFPFSFQSPVHTTAFSFGNAYVLMRFLLSSTLKGPKTLIDTRYYDAFLIMVFFFKTMRFQKAPLLKPFIRKSPFSSSFRGFNGGDRRKRVKNSLCVSNESV